VSKSKIKTCVLIFSFFTAIIARDLFLKPKDQITTQLMIASIKLYKQSLSPLLSRIAFCRSEPSCSAYAILELEKNGLAAIMNIIPRAVFCR